MLPVSVFLVFMALPIIILMPLIVIVCATFFCSNGFNNGNAFAYNTSFNISMPISVVLLFMDTLVMVVVELLIVVVCQFLLF
jgi:hypothetical protein